jgi:hypothetical protein
METIYIYKKLNPKRFDIFFEDYFIASLESLLDCFQWNNCIYYLNDKYLLTKNN